LTVLGQPRLVTSPDLGAVGAARPRLLPLVREISRRHRRLIAIIGTLGVAGLLALVLAGRREEFATALSSAPLAILALAAALQTLALVSRSEAWHRCILAAGGTTDRRTIYRASGIGFLGSLLNAQVGVAARIAALRRSAPATSPCASTLVAAEFPILAVEGMLAALTSFTLVGPLGLPWWLPLVGFAVLGTLSTGLRHLALREGRALWKGLAVLRSGRGSVRLVAFVMVAVFAQIFRNWLLLHAVGVDASFFDSIAVLIAMVTLSQLPVGPTVGAAATVLILGSEGVAAVAAAGILTTVTGTIGGLTFAGWAGLDRASARRRLRTAVPAAVPAIVPARP
jgi:uncharacterized membrane protein YbhN (UPF0104 family)